MRDCDNVDVQDVLPDYASGALDAAARARVESHLDACEACRAELQLLRGVRAMHRAPAVDVAAIVAALPRPQGAAPGVVSLDAHRARREARRGAASSFPWRRAAGIVAVLFAGGVTWGVARHEPTVAPPRVVDTTRAGGATPVTPGGTSAAPATPQPAPSGGQAPAAAPARVDVAALGSLGGVASDASEEEIAALMAALEDISSVPEVEAAAEEGGA